MVMRMSLRSGEIVTCGARRKTPGSPGPDNTNAGVPDRLRAFRANTCRYRYTRSANPAWSASFRQAGRFPRKPCYRRNGSPGCARPSLRTRRSLRPRDCAAAASRWRSLRRRTCPGQVLLLEFVFRALEHGAVENAAFGETDLAQRLDDGLGIEFAHAVEIHGCDGGTFLHDHDDDIIVGLDLHIGEKPVPYRRRIASVASSSVNFSPTFTGR